MTSPSVPLPDVERLRMELVDAGRRLGARGLIAAGEGNLSVRVGDHLLITPSGRRKDELRSGDLLLVPIEPVAGAATARGPSRPSSDLAIHRAVVRTRPDVAAVVHAHLPAAMALTLAGEIPDSAALPETALLLPRLPFVPFGTPGSEELAARIAAALSEGPDPRPGAALLERHGAVAVGVAPADGARDATTAATAALAQALDRLELVEVLCRAWRDALLLRAARGDAT
jgi:L-fuculose-phosphate aldolase